MQTIKKTLAVSGTDVMTGAFSPGITGMEVVSCTGELTINYAGKNSGSGTILAQAGDTFRFDRDHTPEGFSLTSDSANDTIEIRIMRGSSWRLPNSTLTIANPLPVSGSQPFGSSLVTLGAYEAPVIPGMILDESHQGAGPFDVKPFGTYTGNWLGVEMPDEIDGFIQAFGSGVTVQRIMPTFGCMRFDFGVSGAPAGIMTFTDLQGFAVPIFRQSTGAWIFTGIAPAVQDTFYIPLQGVSVLNMTYAVAVATDAYIGVSPRPMPSFV